MKVEFNINQYVTCELTDHGMNMIMRRGFEPQIIKDNQIKIQLWELMHELGNAMHHGSQQTILNNKITVSEPVKW